jgi:hypothetical protein
VNFQGVPGIKEEQKSKALGVHDPGLLNNTFYSFGGKFVNIRQQFKSQSEATTSMGMYPEQAKAAYLNKKFKDIKMRTFLLSEKMRREGKEKSSEPVNVVDKEPTAVMNDYTKNIS